MDAYTIIKDKIKSSSMILIGIGEEAMMSEEDGKLLFTLIKDKNYHIVSVSGDGKESGYFEEGKYTNPICDNDEASWENYLKWLQGTLNRDVLVLELGVGFKYPDVIRFPFEKTVYYNYKAFLCRVNDNLYQIPSELKDKGQSYKMSVSKFLSDISLS